MVGAAATAYAASVQVALVTEGAPCASDYPVVPVRVNGLEWIARAPPDQDSVFDDMGSLWHRYRYPAEKSSLNVVFSSRFFFKRSRAFDFGRQARAKSG